MSLTIKTFISCFLMVFLSFNSEGQTNINISNTNLFGGEPYLAVNPTNNQNLVAAWMDIVFINGGFFMTIKTRASFDGGNSWSATFNQPHMSPTYGSADPSMGFNSSGLLYLSYIDYREAPDSGGIYVTRSANGGLSWDTPSMAFDMYDHPTQRPIDRPWMVVDKSGTSSDGTVYITTKPAPWINPPSRNYYKVSTDNGITWSAIANVDGGIHLVGSSISQPLAAPAVTVGGDFVAVYPSYVSSQNPLPSFYLATSDDQGQTFNYQTVYYGVPANSNQNFKKGYQLLTHPSDATKMTFLTVEASNGDADIICRNTIDAGANWSTVSRINDDAIGNGMAQDMVWGSYNETGNLVVTWRDRRNSNVSDFWGAGYDFYYAVSTDNGQTFAQNNKISSQFIPFDSLISENGNDFMSNVYRGDTLCTVWGDTRSGKMQIYFTKTIASTNTTIGVSELNKDSYNWTVSPNPTSDYLKLEFQDNSFRIITIIDEIGRKVWNGTANKKEVEVSLTGVSKGTYLVIVGEEFRKIIIEK